MQRAGGSSPSSPILTGGFTDLSVRVSYFISGAGSHDFFAGLWSPHSASVAEARGKKSVRSLLLSAVLVEPGFPWVFDVALTDNNSREHLRHLGRGLYT